MQRNIKLLAIFNFFTDFIFYAPVAILYFAKVSGSFALGMSVFSVTMFSSAVFEIPTGIFSDIIGRKNTIILGTIAAILSGIFYALGGTYWILIIGAILEGLSRSFYSGNNDALLHDSLTVLKQEHKFHEFLGKTSSLFQVALASSAFLGGFLAQWSFALVMWLSVIPKILALTTALFITDPQLHNRQSGNIFKHLGESILQFKKNKKLQLITITSVTKYALGESSYLFRSVFISTLWPLWAVGISTMLSNIGAAFSYYFSSKIIDKFKPYKALNVEIIYNRTVNILALLFPTIISPILMSTSSLTFGVGSVATQMLLQKEFSQQQRATMGSLNSFLGSIVFGLCAISVGFIGDLYGPTKALLLINLLLLTPLWFYRKIFRT